MIFNAKQVCKLYRSKLFSIEFRFIIYFAILIVVDSMIFLTVLFIHSNNYCESSTCECRSHSTATFATSSLFLSIIITCVFPLIPLEGRCTTST